MKLTLYNAISIDGFIATQDGDSEWVSEVDVEYFEAEMERAGCIVVGRKTFDQYRDELYPVPGITNIVLTSDPDSGPPYDNVKYTDEEPASVLKLAESMGHDEILLVGGGKANGSFFDVGLIDEIILSVHPLILGDGIRLFESDSKLAKLELLSSQQLDEGLVQLKYRVVN